MAGKAGLSNREKIMVCALICLVLVLGIFYLLIKPVYEQYTVLQDEIAENEMVEIQMRQAISGLEQMEKDIASLQWQVRQEAANYYKPLSTDELDDLITSLLQKYHIVSSDLVITEPSYEPVYSYDDLLLQEGDADNKTVVSTATEEEKPSDNEDKSNGKTAQAAKDVTAKNEEETDSSGYVLKSTAEVKAIGSKSDFVDMVDSISKNKSIHISGFTLKEIPLANEELAGFNFIKQYDINIMFEILMYEPLDQ